MLTDVLGRKGSNRISPRHRLPGSVMHLDSAEDRVRNRAQGVRHYVAPIGGITGAVTAEPSGHAGGTASARGFWEPHE